MSVPRALCWSGQSPAWSSSHLRLLAPELDLGVDRVRVAALAAADPVLDLGEGVVELTWTKKKKTVSLWRNIHGLDRHFCVFSVLLIFAHFFFFRFLHHCAFFSYGAHFCSFFAAFLLHLALFFLSYLCPTLLRIIELLPLFASALSLRIFELLPLCASAVFLRIFKLLPPYSYLRFFCASLNFFHFTHICASLRIF